MDLGPLRAQVLALNQEVHGVDATVTRPAPDDEPVEARGIWLTTETEDAPTGTDFHVRNARRVMALSRAEVATVPRGTLIEAPEKAGDALIKTWRVDGLDSLQADHFRVVVIEVDE